jgi:hypothetical protein
VFVMRAVLCGWIVLLLAACTGEASREAQPADTVPAGEAIQPAPVAAPTGDSGAVKLLPVDEADNSFVEFRTETLRALQRRDTAYLFGILAPEIRNSFGGNDGVAGFKRIWKMEQPAQSAVWDALTRALSLGGKRQRAAFVVPYVYAAWPSNIDSFKHVAITGESVPGLGQPNPTSPPVVTLSNSILPLSGWQGRDENGNMGPNAYALVKLPDGRSVWVSAAHAYSPVGWRAFFEKRNGRWTMITFVAGD